MWLQIRLQEPLVLGEVRAGSQFLTGQTYIPARVLRGAWSEWLLQQGTTDQDVQAVVGRLRLGNFFPAADWRRLEFALPMPMSAVSCKRQPGFVTEAAPTHRGHGVVDVLLPLLACRLLEQIGARFPAPFSLVCTRCGDRVEPYGGFYALHRDGRTLHHVRFRPRYHSQTKVALSSYRRAAAEQMLYSASALSPRTGSPGGEEGQVDVLFLGRVQGDGEAVEELKQALGGVALGALHTRGYGRVSLEDATAQILPVEARVRAFNQTLRDLWNDVRRLAINAADLPPTPPGTYFSVDLLAPGVFREGGVPSLVASLTIGKQPLKPILWLTRPDMASGWSTAWGLPKPTNLAARMGSVYVFRVDQAADDLLPALKALETEGVGERRDEGFGECLVCHPFHQEVEER